MTENRPLFFLLTLTLVAGCGELPFPGTDAMTGGGGSGDGGTSETYEGPVCSTDGTCNADCPIHADLDCDPVELPAAAGAHVTPPSVSECANALPLPPTLLDGPGRFVLGTEGATCAVYDVSSNLYVNPDQVLEIQAGVTLRFAEMTMLRVRRAAALHVLGEPDRPAVFTGTSEVPGHWIGLRFDDTIDGDDRSLVEDSTIENAIIEYGGARGESGEANVSIYRSRVAITGSLIRHSSKYGLQLRQHGFLTALEDSTITDNAAAPVWTYPLFVPALTSNNDYTGNAVERVEVFGETGALGRFSGPDTADAYWSRLNVPYHVEGDLLFQVVWTIEPGTRFEIAEDTTIRVESIGGGIVARGTAELPIVFTADEPAMGHWFGLTLENSEFAENALTHVHIEYGGGGETVTYRANLTVTSSLDYVNVAAEVRDCIFRESGGYGLEVRNSDDPSEVLERNTFIDGALEPYRSFWN